MLVEDERGRPLAEGHCRVHQAGRFEDAALTPGLNGVVAFTTVDATAPFVFEVRDRACAIKAGAYLDPDDPAIEYGGTWFDWTLVRDNKSPEATFWPYYIEQLTATPKDRTVDRFWQHEHVVRRPIRALAGSGPARSVTVRSVPVQLRTGPLVRYTDHQRACIWLETDTPALVKVRVKRERTADPERPTYASTVRVGGRHFAIVEVDGLAEDTFYGYTVELAPPPADRPAIPVTPTDVASAFPPLTNTVRKALRDQLVDASIDGTEWLKFRTLRRRYDKALRFATGSCRWYPGDCIGPDCAKGNGALPVDCPQRDTNGCKSWEPDMLDKLGDWLRTAPPTQWPHFQFYGGDQIYADEIGERQHAQFIRARFASRVPGPADPAPSVSARLIDGAWAGRFAHRLVPRKTPGPAVRGNIAKGLQQIDRIYAESPVLRLFADGRLDERRLNEQLEIRRGRRQLTGKHSEDDDEREARVALQLLPQLKSLLVSSDPFRVYAPYWTVERSETAATLQRLRYRSCNFLLWNLPVEERRLPILRDQTQGDLGLRNEANRGHSSANGGRHAADFAEYAFLYESAWTTTKNVRAVLAHVPSFLMFDDHEVTDDWNFDATWVRMIHSTRDHYRMWPKTITDALCAYWVYQGLGNKAPSQWGSDPRMAALERAHAAGTDALPALRKVVYDAVLGAPPRDASTVVQTGLGLDWHYRLPFEPVFLVPDCRSRKRLVPGDEALRVIDHVRKPPQSETIDVNQLGWLRDELDRSKDSVAFVATSTPLLLQSKLMEIMMKPESTAQAWAGADVASGLAAFFGSTALGIASADLLRVFRRAKDLEHMIRDKSWRDMWGLVDRLRRNRSPIKTLALVSGDVHHSYCMTGNLSGKGRPLPELLQITCSGLKTTIRADTTTRVAGAQSSLPMDIGGHHIVPGFLKRAADGDSDVAIYQNAVAIVDVKPAVDVDVRVRYLASASGGINTYVYEYTSRPGYLKNGQPAMDGEEKTLDPGQSIVIDGQSVHGYADAVAWYRARRDVLAAQRDAFTKERYLVPDGLEDLLVAANARIAMMGKRGDQPVTDEHVEAMLSWFDRYAEVTRAGDQKMELIALDRMRAVRNQLDDLKVQLAAIEPALRDLQRNAFRSDSTSKLKEAADVFATSLDCLLVAQEWVRQLATTTEDIKVLGTTLRTQKALHGSRQAWHELMRESTNARVAKLLPIADKLNNVLAAWQLVDASLTLVAGGKTASDRTSAGISFAATVASAGGTLLGASGFFSLYSNLYIGPAVKRILGQIDQLKNTLSTGRNHPYIQLGHLDQVDWSIEPGGREMYEFMHRVMKSANPTAVPPIPAGITKYFKKHRKSFDAGTPKRHGVELDYVDFDDKRVWVFAFRDDIWGMLYGSMKVP